MLDKSEIVFGFFLQTAGGILESAVKKFPRDMRGKFRELLGIRRFLLAKGGRLY